MSGGTVERWAFEEVACNCSWLIPNHLFLDRMTAGNAKGDEKEENKMEREG